VASKSLDSVHDLFRLFRSEVWRERSKKMYVIGPYGQVEDFSLQLLDFRRDDFYQPIAHVTSQNRSAIFGTLYEVIIDFVSTMSCSFCHSI